MNRRHYIYEPDAIFFGALFIAGALPTALLSRSLEDVTIFNEDDPTGGDYYDASFGLASGGSTITLEGPGNDKLPILTRSAARGVQLGLLEWLSETGGAWELFVASPGWQTRDVAGRSHLVLHLNGPSAVASSSLPELGLESAQDIKTGRIQLGNYLAGGVDGDQATWQEVKIPVTAFEPLGGFTFEAFKALHFVQGTAGAQEYILWLDDVRFSSGVGGDEEPPPAPGGLVSRSAGIKW